MAINFIVGDKLIVKRDYVQNTLSKLSLTPNLKRTINLLGIFGEDSVEIVETGTVDVFDRQTALTRFYIKALPQNPQNPNYQRGSGVILYYDSDTLLNNSFELSSVRLDNVRARKVLNSSGSNITKFDVVRYTGFDDTAQLPNIALASAANLSTSTVMGIAEEDIVDGAEGSVIIEGALSGVDTSLYLINDNIYLSDTPGNFQTQSATTSCVIGQVQAIGIKGSINIKIETPKTKPIITGSRGGNAALANLLTSLEEQGVVVDNTTA